MIFHSQIIYVSAGYSERIGKREPITGLLNEEDEKPAFSGKGGMYFFNHTN